MTTRIALCLGLGLSLSLAVGCQNPRGIVRGQAPNAEAAANTAPASYNNTMHGGPQQQHGRHYHTFEYKAPEGLRYPPANQPPAVVQYPYYTLRGPTDFFQK